MEQEPGPPMTSWSKAAVSAYTANQHCKKETHFYLIFEMSHIAALCYSGLTFTLPNRHILAETDKTF